MKPSARVRPLSMDAERCERFESFVAKFRSVFHRADQFLRFRAYLRGLLEPIERKNVESIASAASSVMLVETNLAQSLQHFVSQSPWDHRRLASALRSANVELRRDPSAVWLVHDGVFPKKGRHSIGVQRQFARILGRKINCQVGVFIGQYGPKGYFPLIGRLYLPGAWLRENAEAVEKQIPETDRTSLSKAQLALDLCEELRADGEPVLPIVPESGYLSGTDFRDELTNRGLFLRDSEHTLMEDGLASFDAMRADFGLDHFEGRTWHGWHHHVVLVFAAYDFLAEELLRERADSETSAK